LVACGCSSRQLLLTDASYAVFGVMRTQNGAASAFGFSGEHFTPELDLLHLRARDYQVGTGRFLSADSVQPNAPGTQGYNLYAYVANNPTTWVDPSGHQSAIPMPLPDEIFRANIQPVLGYVTGFVTAARVAVANNRSHYVVAAGGVMVTWLIFACITEGPCREAMRTYHHIAREFGSGCACGVTEWLRTHLPNAPFSYPQQPTIPDTTSPDIGAKPGLPEDMLWGTPANPTIPGNGPRSPSNGWGDGASGNGGGDPWRDFAEELNERIWDRPGPNPEVLHPPIGDIIVQPTPSFGDNIWLNIPAPETLDGFPDAKRVRRKTPVQGGGGKRVRWKDSDGIIYEWDSRHGTVEKYNKKGRHLGEFDPNTGEELKGPIPNRWVEP
jgi:RHS repeat-associated protein